MSEFNMPPGVSTRDIPGQDDDVSEMLAADAMTMRDFFAARAMVGLLASYGCIPDEDISINAVAAWSYTMADAMLKARNA